MDWISYSLVTVSAVADGTFKNQKTLEINITLATRRDMEYVIYLIYCLYPIMTNLKFFILKKDNQTKKIKSSARIRTTAIFESLARNTTIASTADETEAIRKQNIEKGKGSQKIAKYIKTLPDYWSDILTNNLQLANWIMQDGSSGYYNDVEKQPNRNYQTVFHIGNIAQPTAIRDLISKNYDVIFRPVEEQRMLTNRKLFVPYSTEGNINTVPPNNQAILYERVNPYMTPGMRNKVRSPEFLSNLKPCLNVDGLGKDDKGNEKKKLGNARGKN